MTERSDYNNILLPTINDISDIDADEWAKIINGTDENGNSIEGAFNGGIDELAMPRGPVTDRPAADSSKINTKRRTWLDTSETNPVPTYDRGGGSGWVQFSARASDRAEFAYGRRTFEITTSASATGDRIKIGTISDGTTDEKGRFQATLVNATTSGNTYSSTVTMNAGVHTSSWDAEHSVWGQTDAQADDNVGFVITETAGTGNGGANEYHLYVNPATNTDAVLIIDHGVAFGDFDFTPGLTTADYLGTPVYETIPQTPDRRLDAGSIAGGVTNGTEITNIDGANLSVNSGELTAANQRTDVLDDGTAVVSDTTVLDFGSDLSVTAPGDGSALIDVTDSTTTTTLYMSDYASAGGVVDTEFDQAVTDADPDDTIVFDHNTYELASSHTINKSLTIRGVNSTINCTNTSNNNASILFSGGGLGSSTTTTAAASVGQRTVGVNDSTIFAVGDRVLFMESTYGEQTNSRIQFAEITSTATGTPDTITLASPISRDLVSGTNVYVADLLQGATMEGVETAGGGIQHLKFQWCEDPIFRDCHVSEYTEHSLYALDCWKPRMYNVEATSPNSKGSGEGEPITMYRCMSGYIESPRVFDCRRGVDFAWGTRDVTVINPVLHGCEVAGISVHQNDEAGSFTISGGEIVCSDSGVTGHCISMSDTANTYVDGLRLVARQNGVNVSGESHISNVTVEPAEGAGTASVAAFNVSGGNVTIRDCYINDENNVFTYGVWVDGSGTNVQSIHIDVETEFVGANQVFIDGTAGNVSDVTVRGAYRGLGGTSNQGIMLQSDAGFTIDNVDFEVQMRGFAEQCIRLLSEDTASGTGTIDNVRVHDSHMDCSSQALFTDGNGNHGTIHFKDNYLNTGSVSLDIDDPVDEIFVSGNRANGTINTAGGVYKNGYISTGTVTLSSGQATVPTGVEHAVYVALDPSNAGGNASDIDLVASVRYDSANAENVIEITEDSTAVGNPTVGYTILGV